MKTCVSALEGLGIYTLFFSSSITSVVAIILQEIIREINKPKHFSEGTAVPGAVAQTVIPEEICVVTITLHSNFVHLPNP